MSTGEILLNLVFFLFAGIAAAGALGVALGRNIVHSAYALLAVLFSVAAFYAILKVDFVFAAQILIYVGGILVLILFGVMLTHRIANVRLSNESAPTPWTVALTLCLLAILLLVAFSAKNWYLEAELARAALPADHATTRPLGRALIGSYLYPFEAVSVLLLVALIGATYLARKEVKE